MDVLLQQAPAVPAGRLLVLPARRCATRHSGRLLRAVYGACFPCVHEYRDRDSDDRAGGCHVRTEGE